MQPGRKGCREDVLCRRPLQERACETGDGVVQRGHSLHSQPNSKPRAPPATCEPPVLHKPWAPSSPPPCRLSPRVYIARSCCFPYLPLRFDDIILHPANHRARCVPLSSLCVCIRLARCDVCVQAGGVCVAVDGSAVAMTMHPPAQLPPILAYHYPPNVAPAAHKHPVFADPYSYLQLPLAATAVHLHPGRHTSLASQPQRVGTKPPHRRPLTMAEGYQVLEELGSASCSLPRILCPTDMF